jgi:hypothetical protein
LRVSYVLIGLGVAAALAISYKGGPGASPSPADALTAKVDPEAKQLAVASAAMLQLRASMRDPRSFELAWAAAMPDGAICYLYRAHNGYGGMDEQGAILRQGSLQTTAAEAGKAAWNRECGNAKTGKEITAAVRVILGPYLP